MKDRRWMTFEMWTRDKIPGHELNIGYFVIEMKNT